MELLDEAAAGDFSEEPDFSDFAAGFSLDFSGLSDFSEDFSDDFSEASLARLSVR